MMTEDELIKELAKAARAAVGEAQEGPELGDAYDARRFLAMLKVALKAIKFEYKLGPVEIAPIPNAPLPRLGTDQ